MCLRRLRGKLLQRFTQRTIAQNSQLRGRFSPHNPGADQVVDTFFFRQTPGEHNIVASICPYVSLRVTGVEVGLDIYPVGGKSCFCHHLFLEFSKYDKCIYMTVPCLDFAMERYT